MIYVLLFYIAIAVTYIAVNIKIKDKKPKEKISRTAYSRSSFTTPLKTYKDFDNKFLDKKSKLYTPVTPKGRGVEIKKKEVEE